MAALPDNLDRLNPTDEAIVREHVVDLIAASLAHLTGKQCREPSTATRLVLLKLGAVIETQLSNLNADRETIAALAGISVRYANQVLALENTSLVRLLQERRLARCRNALQDPDAGWPQRQRNRLSLGLRRRCAFQSALQAPPLA
jgi:hypothetical protein